MTIWLWANVGKLSYDVQYIRCMKHIFYLQYLQFMTSGYNSIVSWEKSVYLYVFLDNVHKAKVKSLSHVRLFATPWIVAYQAPPSVGFSRQEYWSGLPLPSPRDLPDPETKPRSLALEADSLPSELPGKPYKPASLSKRPEFCELPANHWTWSGGG